MSWIMIAGQCVAGGKKLRMSILMWLCVGK